MKIFKILISTITSVFLFANIALAEKWLISKGFPKVRVRLQGLSARIELPQESIKEFIENTKREDVVNYFLSLGFTSTSLDLEGLVSGKMNRD